MLSSREWTAPATNVITAKVAMNVYAWRGDFSEAVKRGLKEYKRAPDSDDFFGFELWSLLLALGHTEGVDKIGQPPPFGPYLRRNDPRGLDMVKALNLPPDVFWRLGPLAENVGRVSLLNGRGSEFAALYRGAASSPGDLVTMTEDFTRFLHLAPFVALALRQVGDHAEAERIVAAADAMLQERSNQLTSRERHMYLARIRAVQGRLPEAAKAIQQATRLGSIPRMPVFLNDLELDPALALLKDLPAFQQARQHILSHMARERAELGPIAL